MSSLPGAGNLSMLAHITLVKKLPVFLSGKKKGCPSMQHLSFLQNSSLCSLIATLIFTIRFILIHGNDFTFRCFSASYAHFKEFKYVPIGTIILRAFTASTSAMTSFFGSFIMGRPSLAATGPLHGVRGDLPPRAAGPLL